MSCEYRDASTVGARENFELGFGRAGTGRYEQVTICGHTHNTGQSIYKKKYYQPNFRIANVGAGTPSSAASCVTDASLTSARSLP